MRICGRPEDFDSILDRVEPRSHSTDLSAKERKLVITLGSVATVLNPAGAQITKIIDVPSARTASTTEEKAY